MFLRFVFGLLFGSFLNVLASRYREDELLLSQRVLGGRSHCPNCGKTLSWLELIPLISFLIQKRRCRSCKAIISYQYPAAEILSGLIFAFVPVIGGEPFTSSFWVLVFLILLLISLIDLRLSIIPDELNLALLFLGISALFLRVQINFAGPYSLLFGFQNNQLLNHIVGALVLGALFGLIILATRNKGMGMGDLKLAVPLGLIFGWPGGLIAVIFSFVIGALVGVFLIVSGKKNRKQHIPFGPFLAVGTATLFFFGESILRFYFQGLASMAARLFGA